MFKRERKSYSCFQKGSRNVLFFLLLGAFRHLNVAEKKWVDPTHLMYIFFQYRLLFFRETQDVAVQYTSYLSGHSSLVSRSRFQTSRLESDFTMAGPTEELLVCIELVLKRRRCGWRSKDWMAPWFKLYTIFSILNLRLKLCPPARPPVLPL